MGAATPNRLWHSRRSGAHQATIPFTRSCWLIKGQPRGVLDENFGRHGSSLASPRAPITIRRTYEIPRNCRTLVCEYQYVVRGAGHPALGVLPAGLD